MTPHASQGPMQVPPSSAGTQRSTHHVWAPKARRWALVGSGVLAEALAAAWPYPEIQLVQWPVFDKHAPAVDGVLEAVGGVTPALDVSLTALARGVPVVTSNALLLATHGAMLSGAARQLNGGLRLGMEGAALGTVPVAALLNGAEEVALSCGGAAHEVLQRMVTRGETGELAEHMVRQRGKEGLEDLAGKQTLLRALVLHGLWRQEWPSPTSVLRVPPGALTAGDIKLLAGQGLNLAYGAVVSASQLYVGPVAQAGSVEMVSGQMNLTVTTQAGPQMLQTQANPLARAVAGMLMDVHQLVHGSGLLPMQQAPQWQEKPRWVYCRHVAAEVGAWRQLAQLPERVEGQLALPLVGEPTVAMVRQVEEQAQAGRKRAA